MWLGTSSRVTARRARATVSRTWLPGPRVARARAAAALRKPMSKGALCATSTAPRANSRNAGQDLARSAAAPRTIDVVMPVSVAMKAGTGTPGSTRVWNSPRTSPPRTLTAPISVIARRCAGEPPVVSRSTTTNVTCATAGCRCRRGSAARRARSPARSPTAGRGPRPTPYMERRYGGPPTRQRRAPCGATAGRGCRPRRTGGRVSGARSVRGMIIDCGSCTVRGEACADCVVTFLTIPVRPGARCRPPGGGACRPRRGRAGRDRRSWRGRARAALDGAGRLEASSRPLRLASAV